MPPISISTPPNFLLLCDSDKLARLVELILDADGHCQTILLDEPLPWSVPATPWDLLLIAFSRPAAEPLSVLSRASLTQWVGRRPILIIMPTLFASRPDELIWYLEFPWAGQTLSHSVTEILASTANLRQTAAGEAESGTGPNA